MSALTYTNRAASAASQAEADRAIRDRLQHEFSRELVYLSVCVLGALTLFRALHFLVSRVRRSRSNSTPPLPSEKPDAEGQAPQRLSSPTSLRRLPLAFAAFFRNVAFRIPIPLNPCGSIAELTFILVYIAANLIWLFVDTRDLTRMFYQDRAAHLGTVQMSMVVALAGKNNVVSFLTGVSHEKLHVLHRAAARMSVLLLWMHAISRTVSVLPPQFDYTHTWMQAGAVGLVSFSLVTALSLRPIRNIAFEFFLVSHIIFVALSLAAAIVHTRYRRRETYIWPAFVVWGLDRIIRLGRVIFNNWSRRFRKSDTSYSTASVALLGRDTIRLTLRRRLSWKAGQHAYVILPTVSSMPTEAHPFTIASIPNAKDSEDNELVFLIRARRGFTARLKELAQSSKDGSATVPAFVDGPYGCPPDPTEAATCVLIAGGSGISFTLPLLQQAIAKAGSKRSNTKRIVFIWAVRDTSHLGWVSRALGSSLINIPPSLLVDIRIFVTRGGSGIPVVDLPVRSGATTPTSHEEGSVSIETSEIHAKAPAYDFLRIEQGRPDVSSILKNEMELAAGHVQVDVAGPTPMAHSVKAALRSVASAGAILRGTSTVSLHVESFGMVSK